MTTVYFHKMFYHLLAHKKYDGLKIITGLIPFVKDNSNQNCIRLDAVCLDITNKAYWYNALCCTIRVERRPTSGAGSSIVHGLLDACLLCSRPNTVTFDLPKVLPDDKKAVTVDRCISGGKSNFIFTVVLMLTI